MDNDTLLYRIPDAELENYMCDTDEEDALVSSSPFRYHNISHDDMLNGNGLRVVLWMSGCSHKCPGCQNPETWDCNGGIPFTEWDKAEVYEQLSKDYIKGITFSGGDPLYVGNREAVHQLILEVRKLFPTKDVWLYTGYTLKQSERGFYFSDDCPWYGGEFPDQFTLPWLDQIDVIVDGHFDKDIRAKDLKEGADPHWRGSSNQRVIDIKETLKECKIIELGGV